MADDTTVRVNRATLDRVFDAAVRSGFRLTAKAATAAALELLAGVIEGRGSDAILHVEAPRLVFTLTPSLRRRLNQVTENPEGGPSTLKINALPPKGFRTFQMASFVDPDGPAQFVDPDVVAVSDGKVWVQLLEDHAMVLAEQLASGE